MVMLSNGCCCGVETFVWWQHAFPWWSISLVNYGCNHQRTTASTNFLCSHKILCNAHNTCMSKTTMLDTRISSAAHILMENVTVIFLNTTQAEPLCDHRWRKWADITFITPQGNCMIIEISCTVGFSLSKCVGNQRVTEATCNVVKWKTILLLGMLVEP